MDKHDALLAYQEIIKAQNALNSLRDSIITLNDGYDASIPTNSNEYIAKMYRWILDSKLMVEHELVGKEV